MPTWRLRDFHDDDLDQVISIWDRSRHPDEPMPVFPISEVVSAAGGADGGRGGGRRAGPVRLRHPSRAARCDGPRGDLDQILEPAAESVDIAELVGASEMFTPADIEFAARKGAQFAFEREIEFHRGEPARTRDYLTAIGETRPTLTEAAVTEFEEDIELRTRL